MKKKPERWIVMVLFYTKRGTKCDEFHETFDSEHQARRTVLKRYLDRGIFVKAIEACREKV